MRASDEKCAELESELNQIQATLKETETQKDALSKDLNIQVIISIISNKCELSIFVHYFLLVTLNTIFYGILICERIFSKCSILLG